MPNCTKTYHTISQTTILNAFTKSDISTQPLTPPKKHVNIFENQKLNATPQTPKEKYISSILFFHQDLCTVWDTEQPENSNLTNPLLMHYPWPKQIQKDSKDPKLILILTMKQVYRYFWLVLPIGKLFWSPSFGPSKLMTFQQHNLLKSQVWFRCESQSDLWCSWSPLDLVNFRSRHVLLHDAGTEFSVQSLLKTTQSKLRFSGTIFPHFTLGVSHTRTHTHTHTHTHRGHNRSNGVSGHESIALVHLRLGCWTVHSTQPDLVCAIVVRLMWCVYRVGAYILVFTPMFHPTLITHNYHRLGSTPDCVLSLSEISNIFALNHDIAFRNKITWSLQTNF